MRKDDVFNRIVLDASIAVAWSFEDEIAHYAGKILDLVTLGTQAVVPCIWPAEVANAFLIAERRKRITEAEVIGSIKRLEELPIFIDPVNMPKIFREIIHHARTWKLTLYDAIYLELAIRERLPLATIDESLKKAAHGAGIAPA